MTLFGFIPFTIRPAFQLLLGLALMVAPFALGIEVAGAIVAVTAGALVTGVALLSTVDDRGVTALPLRALRSFDFGLDLGLLGAACVLGLSGYRDAMVLLATFGAAHLLLTVSTRWTLRA